jgi:hypothetical protein
MALNCMVVPGAILGLTGVTAIEDSVTGGVGVPVTEVPPPLPHAASTVTSNEKHAVFNKTALHS